jgi:hypothetical protein
MSQNEDNLRLLSIFHYIIGTLAALFSFLTLPFLVIAYPAFFVFKQVDDSKTIPSAFWPFLLIPCVGLIIIWIFAALIFAAGRSLAKHKRYTFCLVIAVIECLFIPFGSVLGVLTLILLTRSPVKQLFDLNNPLPPVVPA